MNTSLKLDDGLIVQTLGEEYDSVIHAESIIWPGGIPDRKPKCDYDRRQGQNFLKFFGRTKFPT